MTSILEIGEPARARTGPAAGSDHTAGSAGSTAVPDAAAATGDRMARTKKSMTTAAARTSVVWKVTSTAASPA